MQTFLSKLLLTSVMFWFQTLPAEGSKSQRRSDQVALKTVLSGPKYNARTICSGQAPNTLMKVILDRGLSVGCYRLQPDQIAHIRLRQGSQGIPFRRDSGAPLQFRLPAELLTDKYSVAREQFEAARQRVLQQLTHGRMTYSSGTALQRAVERLQTEFTANNPVSSRCASARTFQRYREILRFLSSLERETGVLIKHDGSLPAGALVFEGQTLCELIDPMNQHYLEFAPCGCERQGAATYNLLYELLLRTVEPLRTELVADLQAELSSKARAAAEKYKNSRALVHERSKKIAAARGKRIEDKRYEEMKWRAYWR